MVKKLIILLLILVGIFITPLFAQDQLSCYSVIVKDVSLRYVDYDPRVPQLVFNVNFESLGDMCYEEVTVKVDFYNKDTRIQYPSMTRTEKYHFVVPYGKFNMNEYISIPDGCKNVGYKMTITIEPYFN